VAEQALDVRVVEAGHGIRVEARERLAEGWTLTKDRGARESGLERLETDPLEEAALVAHGHAPLGVVVVAQQWIGSGPRWPREAVLPDDESGHAADSRSRRTRLA